MYKKLIVSLFLLLTLTLTGCGTKNESISNDTQISGENANNDKNTISEKTNNKKGELEIAKIESSSIINNAEPKVMIDESDEVLPEEDRDLEVTAVFKDEDGDGVIVGESGEILEETVTIKNISDIDYTIQGLIINPFANDIGSYDSLQIVSVTDPLATDGFSQDNGYFDYKIDFSLPAGEEVEIVTSQAMEGDAYSIGTKKVLSVKFAADAGEDTDDVYYDYGYTLKVEPSEK